MDPQYDRAEAILAKIRPRFYADGLSEFEMLLRVRESARVKPFEIALLVILFYPLVLSSAWKWGPWLFVGLAIMTFLEYRYYLSQRKELDAAIALFLEHSPKSLDDLRNEKRA